MKTTELVYNTKNVMTCSGVGQLRRFFKSLQIEMAEEGFEPSRTGQLKIGQSRTYLLWCNSRTNRRLHEARVTIVRKSKDKYWFRIREL